jgi:hypothetical protein
MLQLSSEQDMIPQRISGKIEHEAERPLSAAIVWMLSSWPGWGEIARDNRVRTFITFAFTMLYYSKLKQFHNDDALLLN